MDFNSDQQFTLRWTHYQKSVTDVLRGLLKRQILVDVILACDGEIFRAHQTILSACSLYFEKILLQNTHPLPIIFLRDVKYWEMKALLQFMYEGEANVRRDRLSVFLKTAESLQICGLARNAVRCERSDEQSPISLSLSASRSDHQNRYNVLVKEKSSKNSKSSRVTRETIHIDSQVRTKNIISGSVTKKRT
jgi:hypothetical protein